MKVLMWILIGGGIFFSLPSTMYLAVFKGIFGRVKKRPRDLKVWCRGDEALEARFRVALEQFDRLPFTDVTITSFDGKRLCGRYLNRNRGKLMIMAHGYRTMPEINFALQIPDLLEQGYDLLLIDHRAHGESQGLVGSMGQLEGKDLLGWIQWAPYDRVAVYGVSMGCAAVGYACGDMDPGKVRALIMDCGFSNFYDELNYKCELWHSPKAGFAPAENLLTRLILRVDLRRTTMEALRRCRVPVFFIHGGLDTEVPVEEMHRQYEACAAEKECLVVENAHHALAYAMGGQRASQAIRYFLERFVG